MGLKIWKVLRFLRDVLTFIPLPGSQPPRVEVKSIVLATTTGPAEGKAINVSILGGALLEEYAKDSTLLQLIPDPSNSVVLIFSGANATAARRAVGLDPFA